MTKKPAPRLRPTPEEEKDIAAGRITLDLTTATQRAAYRRVQRMRAAGPTAAALFARELQAMTGEELETVRERAKAGHRFRQGRPLGALSALGHEVADYRHRHQDATFDDLVAHLESRTRVAGSAILHVAHTAKRGWFVEWRPHGTKKKTRRTYEAARKHIFLDGPEQRLVGRLHGEPELVGAPR